MKSILLFVSTAVILMAGNIKAYQYSGVKVKHEDEHHHLEREIDPRCLHVPMNSGLVWEGSYASKEVPEACKATFVTVLGQIQPITLHPKVETYGEMEVMHFLKQAQNDDSLMLVDSRSEPWFEYRSIPGAVNVPHSHISKMKSLPEEYQYALTTLGIEEKSDSTFDFSKAKTIVLFCNGSWCGQSPGMIRDLMTMGYPPEKLKWYRGGMHDWLALSMTSTRKLKR
ncbi:MAG TPA: rhodanese-like domain-containing protein [Epsilonproteobacteria bacterium]|nr:rhodanese-like domain-containing protein [Campylobacterota bacterium]HHD72330.1 rhodanese-like domain-containing protein [Campylobacterota bacterium]